MLPFKSILNNGLQRELKTIRNYWLKLDPKEKMDNAILFSDQEWGETHMQ